MSERVQLSRQRGWRMPPNTIKVTRPGRWGNPFRIGDPGIPDAATAVRLFALVARGGWSPSWVEGLDDDAALSIYRATVEWQKRIGQHPLEAAKELCNKNLACWCRIGEPCHADVLLETASHYEQCPDNHKDGRGAENG